MTHLVVAVRPMHGAIVVDMTWGGQKLEPIEIDPKCPDCDSDLFWNGADLRDGTVWFLRCNSGHKFATELLEGEMQ